MNDESEISKNSINEKSLKIVESGQLKTIIRKVTFGALGPLGIVLDEVYFEQYGRIKQERVNSFVKSFLEYLDKSNIAIDIPNPENFGDVFEMIIRKVSQTKSENKVKIFRRILTNEVLKPSISSFKETFIDIAGQLHEEQVKILIEHLNVYEEKEELVKKIRDLEARIERSQNTITESLMNQLGDKMQIRLIKVELNKNQKKLRDLIDKLDKINSPKFPNSKPISLESYNFYKQDLLSKSLLLDTGITIKDDYIPLEFLQITDFGIEFLKFIKTESISLNSD